LSLLVQTDDSKLRKVSATASDINVDLDDTVINNDPVSETNERDDTVVNTDAINATKTVDTATVTKDAPHSQVTMAMYKDTTCKRKESLGPKPSDNNVTVENKSTTPHVRFAPELMGATGGEEGNTTVKRYINDTLVDYFVLISL